MFKTLPLLKTLVCALPLLASGSLLAGENPAPDARWQQTLDEAKGQTVYFNAWGGSPEINGYLVWAGQELERQYGVKLVQVKVDDIAPSVSQLLASKQAGKNTGGPIDLLWVNGENFKALKEQGLLGVPFTGELPNMALVDMNLPVSEDFTVPVAGLEAPWGIGQLNLMVNGEEVTTPPTSAAALLAWAKANPGRFTYPKPPQFHGSSFLKQILLELTPDPAPLYREATDAEFERLTAPLWVWLDALHPALWRKGKLFPASAAETRQLLDDGELAMAISFNPGEAQSAVQNGALPPGVVAVAMAKGALTNSHFLAIPFNASARAGAKVAANFLLSPAAQARKVDPAFWGDPSVLRADALPASASQTPALRFKAVAEPHPSWQLRLEEAWAERYGH
ncbi:ABC transporter substrate-binding protein [Aeromonas enteropelogenes]|uniref:ABC transporter substrate-binding protein n=1 Tax=Aeromonas enteropelogenes TaxID=29489 RepID=UPI0005A8F65A|nr:ABC transporter substrate-binding protein [Aeromonas enteropelogenes]MBL0520084.1 ABC transporter substrate-binding protein [Aeromonas enteropelogenes]UBH51010.1 ABC transporter substrate-binding protein [Aeromonas enteropelogenes]